MALLPPPQYNVPPSIPVIDRVLSHDEVQKICNPVVGQVLMPGQFWIGCNMIINGKCYIWRVDNKFALQHEMAHCNGWGKDHKGGW